MPFGILMGTPGYRLLDLRSRDIRPFKCPIQVRSQVSAIEPTPYRNSKSYYPIYKMHIKSFVLASFAASIATAIPIPQACAFDWKRSANKACIPQTQSLPSLLPYLQDPSSVPNPTSSEYYAPDTLGTTSPTTPADNKTPEPQSPPQPLIEYAPWVGGAGGAGLGGWGLSNLWKSRVGSPTDGISGGN